jgi:DmsE family decaheme c-type cytochrome
MKSNKPARVGCSGGNAWQILVPVLLVGLMLASQIPMVTAAQNNRANGQPEAQYTAEGTERCLSCHAGERMTIMAETAHGNSTNSQTPFAKLGCESCHGPGSLHVSRARGGRGFPAMITFGESDTVQRQTAACIGCHADDMGDLQGIAWTGSAHDTDSMTCVSCHEAHIVGNALREQKRQRENCSKCHDKQIASHPRFEDKGIVFDKLSCFDCHDVHQLIHEP